MNINQNENRTPLHFFTKHEWGLTVFTLFYVAGFTTYFLLSGNYEFIMYVGVVLFFLALVLATLHRSPLTITSLWLLSLWGLLHMAGGGIAIGGGNVLYNLHVIPIVGTGDFSILKYDQIVHAYGFGVATFIVYQLIRPYVNERANWKVLFPIIVVAGVGLGAINEIVEFIATISIQNVNVGGYYNTALDLVFNTLGAVISVIIIHFSHKRTARRKINTVKKTI